MSRRRFVFVHLSRQLWVQAVLFAVLAVAAALVALWLAPTDPVGPELLRAAGAVESLLTIIASSMLAVATFALSTLIAAFSTVQSTASPRAAALLIEDRSAQTALSGFMGAFIFSVVALVALATGAYDPQARAVLFVETAVVLALVVVVMLRWINEASRLGLMSETIDRVERATVRALQHMRKRPYLGAAPAVVPPPGCFPVTTDRVGYIQHIDVGHLELKAERLDLRVHLQLTPGDFVDGSRPLALVEACGPPLDADALARLADGFVIGEVRTFDQDPGYGLILLREIACRALSPAVNDAGTAIAVIATTVRVLRAWSEPERDDPVEHPRVRAATLDPAELFDDVFTPVARDGAGLVEVGLRLQAAFQALAAMPTDGFADAARVQALMALERARRRLDHAADLARLERAARPLLGSAAGTPHASADGRRLAEALP